MRNESEFLLEIKRTIQDSLMNEIEEPKVRSSVLAKESRFLCEIAINLHNALDEKYVYRKVRTLSASTKKQAEKESHLFEEKVREIVHDVFLTKSYHELTDFMGNKWLPEKIKTVDVTTADSYLNKFKLINAYFTAHPVYVETLTTAEVNKFSEWALENGRVRADKDGSHKLKRRTVVDTLSVLKMFFADAIKYGMVSISPVESVSVRKERTNRVEKTDFFWLDMDKYSRYRAWLIENDKMYDKLIDIVDLAIVTGMRREEILGLKWSEVDFDNSQIEIRRTRVRVGSNAIDREDVKTEASHRVYNLPTITMESLHRVKEKQLEAGLYESDGFVYKWLEHRDAEKVNSPYDPDYITKLFKKSVTRCEFTSERMTFHHLRHSCVSILFEQGWGLEEVMNWVGHSDSDVTKNIYNHYKKKIESIKVKELNDKLVKSWQNTLSSESMSP